MAEAEVETVEWQRMTCCPLIATFQRIVAVVLSSIYLVE